MRRPIEHAEAFGWWQAALASYPAEVPSEPRCGFYRTRLAKGGVFVPARIWLEQDIGEDGELLDDVALLCEVNGKPADAEHWWPYLAGHPISEAEFKYLSARNVWAECYSPKDYAAKPHEKIDHLKSPVLF